MNMITITMREFVASSWCGACVLRGPEKGNLTFQRYAIIDAKRQQTSSVKIKTDLS